MPVAGKAELNKSGWLTSSHMRDAPKIKRACSDTINLALGGAIAGLMYTSTPITVIKAVMYRIGATVGTSGAIDVGINGNDDAIVSAEVVAVGNADTLLECTIADGSVAAGKAITFSVETVVGTSGTAAMMIEYTEDN